MKQKLKTVSLLSFLIITQLILISCSSGTYEKIYPTLMDGKYDSEFPYRGSSEELEKISQTVQRINSTGFYKTYIFSSSDKITVEDIRNNTLENLAIETGFANQSSSGTGTIIYYNRGRVALLTCAHVVNHPDTVISYIPDSEGLNSDYLDAIMIKTNQSIYAAGFPEGSDLEIIAMDEKMDIVLIGRQYNLLENYIFPVFNYPLGRAKDLEWGSFVYVLGYPMNYKMITKALVSSPNLDNNGSFLLDAVVNQGYSGGIVLAIKDGVPNFELVGIVQWVPEENENLISPAKRKNNEPYNSFVPYKGDLFVKRYSSIKYGITKVISIESILEFFESKKSILQEKGYYLENYLSE